jgi:hypothetical protein
LKIKNKVSRGREQEGFLRVVKGVMLARDYKGAKEAKKGLKGQKQQK